MGQKNTSALIIFIKNAELGKVKTRLARTLGDEKALKIYLALLKHTRQVALSVELHRYLFYSNYINQQDDWPGDSFQKELQAGADLGDRLSNAFKNVSPFHQKLVVIGSDCAQLNSSILKKAYEILEHKDFVVGPAMDGGYYLLGMTQFYPEVFQNILWSSSSVLESTLAKIRSLNKTYLLLPELSDIDTEVDWLKYGWTLDAES